MEKTCKISVISKDGEIISMEYPTEDLNKNFEYGKLVSEDVRKGNHATIYFAKQGNILLGENDKKVEVLLPQSELTSNQKVIMLDTYGNEEGNLVIGIGNPESKDTYLCIPTDEEYEDYKTKYLSVKKLFRDDQEDIYNFSRDLTEDEIYEAFKKQTLSR